LFRRYYRESVGLLLRGSDFGNELVWADANGGSKLLACPDFLFDPLANFPCLLKGSGETQIQVCFVNAGLFYEGCVASQYLHDAF
jgi:hypothetical protein